MIFLYIAIALLVITFLISLYVVRVLFFPKTFTREECRDYDLNKGFFDEEFLTGDNVSEVSITNDGLTLYGQYVDNNSEKTIILMHGYTSTFYGMYKYLNPYIKNNFNILLPDQRYHGKSEGRNTTLGYKEHTDLRKWIAFIKEINPYNKVIGLHGESMGAATVLLEGHNKDVDFIISDCGFSTFRKQVQRHLWNPYKIPKFFIYPASLVGKILYDAPILPVNPVDNVKNITAPIFLVHGNADSYIEPSHYHDLKAELKPTDMYYLCEGANHAQSYETDPETYEKLVVEFLTKNNMI